uniref:Uncharacterized protein n=1 Tax=Skeletonema marinoi TaxID=267567 RepID=A0A7S2PQ34_9STRA
MPRFGNFFSHKQVAASKSAEKAGEGSMNSNVYKGRQPAKHLPRGKDLQRRANRIATTLTPSQESYYCSLALAAADALVTCLLPASLNWTAPATRPHISCGILATCKVCMSSLISL